MTRTFADSRPAGDAPHYHARTRHSSLGTLLGVALGGVLGPLAGAGAARAESPYITELAPGYGGEEDQDGGPGNEQPSTVAVRQGDDVYVVTVFMSSDVEGDYWQCKCSSVRLSPGALPALVADRVQLTDNGGDRPCNHPKAATDGEHIVWTYGSNRGSTNTRTYAGVLSPMCTRSFEEIRISDNGNNNEGAPDVAYNGEGRFTAGYLSTGGNDRSYARGLTLDTSGPSPQLRKEYLTNVVSPANIGRPAIVAASGERSLFCAARGDNRPPERGVQCGYLDTTTGEVLWRQYIAESDPDNDRYMNQPSVAKLDFGLYAIQVIESTGQGRKKNQKGGSVAHLYVVEPTDGGMQVKAHEVGVGPYQAHSAICAGRYGTDGARGAAVFDASITGVGQPAMQLVGYDPALKAIVVDTAQDQWVAGYYGDSGYLAHLYGANPGSQGRDFLRCIGDIPNPSHGVEGGFKPLVKTFFAAPHAGRKPGEPKNALFLTLIPGEVDVLEDPEPPAPPTDPTTTASGSGGAAAAVGAGGAPEADGAGGTSATGPLAAPSTDAGATGGCALAVPHETPGWPSALLGLALTAVALRRREDG